MQKSFNKDKYQILNYELNVHRIAEISEEFARQKTEPVLIKGLAAAQNYPKPYRRTFSDIDFAVAPKFYERARKIIAENHFNVDLHSGLRHLDTLDWDDLFQNSKIITIGKTNIRVLRAEDHLRVLCVHWLNDGGADRTRLWDIYFALQNKPPDFDWERFLGGVGEKRKKWLMTVILLARDYLGLSLENLPNGFEKYEIPVWIKSEVEKEWRSDVRLTPIEQVLNDRRRLFRQILKRVPPNALQAVVETEASLKDSREKSVIVKNFLQRIKPSIKRVFKIESEN